MKRAIYVMAVFLWPILGCEPDDICIQGTSGTPQMIVVFYDYLQPEIKKEVTDLQVIGLDQDVAFYSGTTDSVAIPLKAKELASTYTFKKVENNLTLEESWTFEYNTYDAFISLACGYKKLFSNLTSERQNSMIWIKDLEIINDSISEINTTHVKIYH